MQKIKVDLKILNPKMSNLNNNSKKINVVLALSQDGPEQFKLDSFRLRDNSENALNDNSHKIVGQMNPTAKMIHKIISKDFDKVK